MHDITTTLRAHMWLETEKGQVIGLGRALLLEEIRKQGSLNKAAKALGMSYRAAWGRLKTTEEMIGSPLVKKNASSKGFMLTDLGERLTADFRKWYADVEAYALKTARDTFPWPVEPFKEE